MNDKNNENMNDKIVSINSESNPITLFEQFNANSVRIEEIDNQMDSQSYKTEIADLRSNFGQRLGSMFIDKLLTKSKWVKIGRIPNENELTEIIQNFGAQSKQIIDNQKPLNESSVGFINIKRKNSEYNSNGNKRSQLSDKPHFERLVRIFFDEVENSKSFKNNETLVNERQLLIDSNKAIENRMADLKAA